ncbi:MAG: hypothetical protein LBV26_06815 [Bacteroidales bacterium]|jgi:hypothetical protein|nr:hypothetical protein [Bacteroidales bacterium]
MTRQKLRHDYENACNAYLKAFCSKHGYDCEDAKNSWTGGKVGTIADVADQYVDMEVITTDIDMDVPKGEFLKWYDYCLELGMLGITSTPNYSSWVRGCPRKSEAEIEEIRQARQRIEDAKAIFEAILKKQQV